jgi:hypothetical protein
VPLRYDSPTHALHSAARVAWLRRLLCSVRMAPPYRTLAIIAECFVSGSTNLPDGMSALEDVTLGRYFTMLTKSPKLWLRNAGGCQPAVQRGCCYPHDSQLTCLPATCRLDAGRQRLPATRVTGSQRQQNALRSRTSKAATCARFQSMVALRYDYGWATAGAAQRGCTRCCSGWRGSRPRPAGQATHLAGNRREAAIMAPDWLPPATYRKACIKLSQCGTAAVSRRLRAWHA